MATLNVCLFGRLSLRHNGQVLTGFEARKTQELLCYLLLHRNQSHHREALAATLWSETCADRSKKNLRQVLWQLQSALDRQCESSSRSLLRVDADWVDLNSQADLWLDVAVFEQAFTPVRDVQGRDLDSQRAEVLKSAARLYHGDLLEGLYEDWCLQERERLQNMYLTILDKLMGYCEAHSEYESGIVHGTRVLAFDRAREHTHRQLMRLQYLAGNRTAALRQYERCIAALDAELAVKPANATVALYEQIRDDHVDGVRLSEAQRSEMPEATLVPLPEVLSCFKRLRELLTDVEKTVQQGIQGIERNAGR